MKNEFTALKTLMGKIADEGDFDEEIKATKSNKSATVIVVGSQSAGVPQVVRELQRKVRDRHEAVGSDGADSMASLDTQAGNWAEYQVAHLALPGTDQSSIVFHLLQVDGNSKLGDLIKQGHEESHDDGKKTFLMNRWLGEQSPIEPEDSLSSVRPPACISDWQQSIGIVVLTLSEASQMMRLCSSHVDIMKALISPVIRATTDAADRELLRERVGSVFPKDVISRWRIEAGMQESEPTEALSSSLPIPLMVVVNDGDLVDKLRERAYYGQRDIIEAALLKMCNSIGASCLFISTRAEETNRQITSQNVDVLVDCLQHMVTGGDPVSLAPPILPACLTLPTSEDKKLIWVPNGLITTEELTATDTLKELGGTPFDIAITFTGQQKGLAVQEAPVEITAPSLRTFVESLGDQIVELSDTEGPRFLSSTFSNGSQALKEKGSKQDLKSFFGDIVKGKKSSERL